MQRVQDSYELSVKIICAEYKRGDGAKLWDFVWQF
jgi:hypothetical protein